MLPSKVIAMSVSDPVPNVSVSPSSLVIGPPSAVVPSWVCPVLDAKAANN